MIVKQLDYDLTPVAGLSLVGHLLKSILPVFRRVDAALPIKGGVANGDILRAYMGLLTQGKSVTRLRLRPESVTFAARTVAKSLIYL